MKFNYERFKNKAISGMVGQYEVIKAIETPDPSTVIFKLSQRRVAFLEANVAEWRAIIASPTAVEKRGKEMNEALRQYLAKVGVAVRLDEREYATYATAGEEMKHDITTLAKGSSVSNMDERRPSYIAAHQILMRDVPAIFSYNDIDLVAVRKQVQGSQHSMVQECNLFDKVTLG